jgi:dienelactone hydrolase
MQPRPDLAKRLRTRFELDAHPLTLKEVDPPSPQRRIWFRTGSGEVVGGWLLEPDGPKPAPAILYIHAHGGAYDIGAREVVDGRPALHTPLGPTLVAAGFRVLAIDMPCFGGRAGMREMAAAKAALWYGGSLAGQMLGELASVLGWLAGDAGTDARRIGVFGLSMGATLAYWLAAAEPRLAACAHICCFADFGPLIESGAHDRHGIYLTVPGLLQLASNGEIAGLIAPRPQFVGLGDADPLTPPYAADPALAKLSGAYAAAGVEGALLIHREAKSGHVETLAMRQALTRFLVDTLGQLSSR